ncbi:MAG: HAD-IB family hydrolase [Acidiferrobacterales bacterium]|jgi:phosphatidylglycerophosphatase C|nr:HAD-IB family hydrolase [Acidiferrobacterales bacterium]
MADNKPVVAAFDFDGTLTMRDTLIPFLNFYAGPLKFTRAMARSLPVLAAYGLRLMRNDVAKERLLVHFLAGTELSVLKQTGQRFASGRLTTLLRPTALDRLRWHQAQGHQVVVISASLDIYLEPWARTIGIDHVICTSLESDSAGRVSGHLAGNNCFGPEKLRRLQDSLGDRSGYILYAYGDSRGDHELLASADHAFYRTMPGQD